MYKTTSSDYGSGVITRNKEQQIQKTIKEQINKVGIENIGNTCYINAMLQCLINSQAITHILNQMKEIEIAKSNALFKTFYSLWFRIKAGIEPERNDVVQFKQLMCQYKDFDNCNQQDCIEFFHVFLDMINKPNFQSPFQGQLIHKISCQSCGNTTKQQEAFINLSLYIGQNNTLFQLMNDYFKPESLNSSQNCPKCNKKSQLFKTTNISIPPTILVIHLKRYDQRQTRQNSALFIEQRISLKGICETNPHYKLYAFINHQGYNISSGHYTCLIKTSDAWYNFNDTRVSEYSNKIVDDELNKSQNSYVLFYAKE